MTKLFACAVIASLTFCGVVALAAAPPGATNLTYEPVPAKFKLPASETAFATWMGFDPAAGAPASEPPRMNLPALRGHAWDVFAGLTSPSRLTREGTPGRLPVWETWYTIRDIFEGAALKTHFEIPHQLINSRGEQDARVHVIASIRYNQEVRDFIFKRGLNQLASRNYTGGIPAFPRAAIALKTSWMLVPKAKCTGIPVWDFQPGNVWSPNNLPDSWPRKVFIEPAAGACGAKQKTSLDSFYRIQILTDEERAQIAALGDSALNSVAIGDYLVLVGFHFTTKEIPNWVWGTFWWHDRPNDGPYALDRPKSVNAPWSNYLMDVSYDMDRPWEPDATPKIAYNPYLEGAMVDGMRSNCMTCHRRATLNSTAIEMETLSSFGSKLSLPQIVVRGSEAATATYFPEYERSLKLDFIWSLALHQPKP